MGGKVSWGILGTAHIAEVSFLPALRHLGGTATGVAGRNPAHTRQWALRQQITRAYDSYEDLLDDESIDAVYIPLPNTLHEEWSRTALAAGKAVLCEKPLVLDVNAAEALVAVARRSRYPLWEAFVFPFQPQFLRVQELLASGAIGDLREIQASFHYRLDPLRDATNIRWDPALGGGGFNDVGCYPIHLATLLLGRPEAAMAEAVLAETGVDQDSAGLIQFGEGRRLLFSAGMTRAYDSSARLLGTDGEIRLSSAYHPSERDAVEIRLGSSIRIEYPTGREPSFTHAIAHIEQVVQAQAEPVHTVVTDALPTARAMSFVRHSAGLK